MGLTGTVIAASDGPREAAGRFIKCRRGLEGGVMETLACSGAEPLPPRRRDRARLPVPGPGATPGGGRAPLPPPPAPSPTSASSKLRLFPFSGLSFSFFPSIADFTE